MATPKQIAANRRNAQKSTGPKSVETKAKVAQNGTKHGLCAKFRVLNEVEKQENFDAFLKQLMEDEQPVGQAEIELVVKMAESPGSPSARCGCRATAFRPSRKLPSR